MPHALHYRSSISVQWRPILSRLRAYDLCKLDVYYNVIYVVSKQQKRPTRTWILVGLIVLLIAKHGRAAMNEVAAIFKMFKHWHVTCYSV